MSWGMIGAATITTAGGIYAGSKNKGGEDAPAVNIPGFSEDPYTLKGMQALFPKGQEFLEGGGVNIPGYRTSPFYDESQEALSRTGKGLLEGDVPDAYRSLVTPGGDEFSNFMRGVRRDVTTGVGEDLAKRGIGRGGIGSRAISKAMGEVSGKYGYEDYLRTQQNKAKLFGMGADITAGVGARGLTESQLANVFGMDAEKLRLSGIGMGAEMIGGVSRTGLDLSNLKSSHDLGGAGIQAGVQANAAKIARDREASENQMWSDLMQSGVGMLGNIDTSSPTKNPSGVDYSYLFEDLTF